MARDVAKEWAMFEELMIATFGDHWRAPAMRHLDIDDRALRRWERGERPISLRAWEAITSACHCRAASLKIETERCERMWRAELAEVQTQTPHMPSHSLPNKSS